MLKRRQFFVQICLNRHIPRNKRRPFDPDLSGIFENLSFLLALTRVKKNALKKPVATDSYRPIPPITFDRNEPRKNRHQLSYLVRTTPTGRVPSSVSAEDSTQSQPFCGGKNT
jgi:hypothetical protein